MAKITKTVVDSDLRDRIFTDIFNLASVNGIKPNAIWTDDAEYRRINDRQWGCILTDENGVERYCRVGVIVAEEREDMTARELMQSEIDAYNAKQAEKIEKAKAKKEKIARDKAKREAKEKEVRENA